MQRRDFLKKAIVITGTATIGANAVEAGETAHPIDNRAVSDIAFPEKRPLIVFSDRPPLLETPREVFTSALTPNDLFFVRWHMPVIPTQIDPRSYKIKVHGLVDKELTLS